MPNKNYRRGYELERKVVNHFRSKGYVSFRSAGSHSPCDVVAVNEKEVLMIQLKRSKKNFQTIPKDIRDEVETLCKFDVPESTSKLLWIWVDRKGWKKYILEQIMENPEIFLYESFQKYEVRAGSQRL